MSLMNVELKKRQIIWFSIITVLIIISVGLNIIIGSVHIPFSEVYQIVLEHETTSTKGFIIWNIRISRALAAVLGGAFLSVSGLLLQVFFRNPIVGPFILGISSGATLMVSFVMLTTITLGCTFLSPFITTLAAFAGACATMVIVLSIATRVKSGITLLIVGLMMGYLCHAVTSVLVAFAEKEKIKGFVLWQLGSFSGIQWNEIQMMLMIGGIILLLIYGLSKPLNAFLLGEEYASSMGVNIKLFRILILLCACALAAMVTAVAGPVAFIGLAVPHMARLCFNTSNNHVLVPGSILLGAVITSLCDFIARMALTPVELPLSAITAFFGAPIVLSLLLKRRVSI